MPFTHEELGKILAAVDTYRRETPANGLENARRLRALVLVLRYTGMRISDVVSFSAERISGNRLFLYTQKTGVPVAIVVPDFVIRALALTPRKTANFFFWSGMRNLESAVRSWQTRLRKVFRIAGLANGRPHQLRDTFAVELLLAGIPIERVSILLGHQSTGVSGKNYNPWARSRQEQLEADLERVWRRDPLVLVEAKVTPRLRGVRERLNLIGNKRERMVPGVGVGILRVIEHTQVIDFANQRKLEIRRIRASEVRGRYFSLTRTND